MKNKNLMNVRSNQFLCKNAHSNSKHTVVEYHINYDQCHYLVMYEQGVRLCAHKLTFVLVFSLAFCVFRLTVRGVKNAM